MKKLLILFALFCAVSCNCGHVPNTNQLMDNQVDSDSVVDSTLIDTVCID